MNIVERFSNHLIQVEYPTKQEHWNIAGILKNKSNQHLKFDVRGMSRLPEGLLSKRGYTATKADKMVFETDKEWIILDIPEIDATIAATAAIARGIPNPNGTIPNP